MKLTFAMDKKSLRKFKRNMKIVKKELGKVAAGQALVYAMEIIMAKAIKNAPVDTGTGKATRYVTKYIETVKGLAVEGGFTADYMLYQHEGTKPYMPPVEPLKAWVLRKKITADEEEAEDIAFGIAVMIDKFGIQPNPYFLEAINEIRPRLNSIIKNFIDKKYPQIQSKIRR